MFMSSLGAQRDPASALAWGLYFLFPFSQEGALSCLAAAMREFAQVTASQPISPGVLSDFPRITPVLCKRVSSTRCTLGVLCVLCQPVNAEGGGGGGVTIAGARDAAVNRADRAPVRAVCLLVHSVLYPCPEVSSTHSVCQLPVYLPFPAHFKYFRVSPHPILAHPSFSYCPSILLYL